MNATLIGKPHAGNPHVWFDTEKAILARPRRGSWFYIKTALVVMGCALLTAGHAFADTWYVSPNGDDSKDGRSWETAMKSPELVIDRWRNEQGNTTPNHELRFAKGHYKLNKAIDCAPSGELYNITLRSDSGNPEDVVLDGQGACRGISISGYSCHISGLTVSNCVARKDGAGIAFDNLWGRIENCIVRDCQTIGGGETFSDRATGGGIYCSGGTVSGTVIENCLCRQDPDKGAWWVRGGGVYVSQGVMTNCTVRNCGVVGTRPDNSDVKGGGVFLSGDQAGSPYSAPGLVNCEITDCWAVSEVSTVADGGGVYAEVSGMPGEIRDCLVARCLQIRSGAVTAINGVLLADSTVVCNTNVTTAAASGATATGVTISDGARICGCLIASNVVSMSCSGWDQGIPAIRVSGSGCVISDCAIVENVGASRVGIEFAGAEQTVVTNCVISRNTGTSAGYGGLFYSGNFVGTTNEVIDTYIVDNNCSQCAWGGLMVFNISNAGEGLFRFRNCLIARNAVGVKGISMFCWNAAQQSPGCRLVVENCTVVKNVMAWGTMIDGYHEGSWSYAASSNIYVKGSAVLWNENGDQISYLTRQDTDNVSYTLSTEVVSFPGAVGNLVYDPDKPLFVDANTGDYRPAANSQLCNRVPYAGWMGDGRRRANSVYDLGRDYSVVRSGARGVHIVRDNRSPRFSGDAADIGCCEYYYPLGMSVLIR